MKRFEERKKQRGWKQGESGLIAVEALLGFTIFMFVMYFVYSLLILYMAQNMIGHALTESCQSMALESYGTNAFAYSFEDPGYVEIKDILENWFRNSQIREGSGGLYVSDQNWTSGGDTMVQSVARQRFNAYFGGSEEKTNQMLAGLKVTGLDFDGTGVNGNNLTIQIHYNIRLVFGLKNFDAQQSVTCRMWMK